VRCDRRHGRGRPFFFGPPDELLAKWLREKGVIHCWTWRSSGTDLQGEKPYLHLGMAPVPIQRTHG
jgi:hypothetical protein